MPLDRLWGVPWLCMHLVWLVGWLVGWVDGWVDGWLDG